jgi:hypothetical protein
MILCRFRSLAGVLLLAGLAFGASLTAIAQAKAAVYVTPAEMQSYFWTWFLSGAGAILGGLAIVYGMLDKSKSSELRALIKAHGDQVDATAKALDKLAAMFAAHHLDADAHPAGSRARIDPINEKLDDLKDGQNNLGLKLERLYTEHRQIRRTEMCLMKAVQPDRRDPMDSPRPRREDDPEDFDGTPLRGLEE